MNVSVALTTCNGARYLREQLDSILRQDWPVDEIVVGDDGSSDGTRELLEACAREAAVPFDLHFHEAPLGTVRNVEFVVQRCSGDVIFLSDQDDVWHRGKVRRMVSLLQARPDTLLAFCDGDLIDSDARPLPGTLWHRWGFTPRMRRSWAKNGARALRDLVDNDNKVTGATVAFRRRLLEHALPMELPQGHWHDAWLALHAMANGGLAFIDEPLISYRIHASQQVGVTPAGAVDSNADAHASAVQRSREALARQYPDLAAVILDPSHPGSLSPASRRLRHALRSALARLG
ncbi:MAG: glycosyltransferase family 2 protein [Caldimonas sp.]